MNFNTLKNISSEALYQISKTNGTIDIISFFTKNYGDYYNKIIVNKILNKKTHIVDINLFNNLYFGKNLYKDKELLCAIGSILHFATENSIVWGTGSIWYNSVPKTKPKEILSVRGKLTQKNLKDNGFIFHNIIGDPRLLLKKYIDNQYIKQSKKFKLGIIPHHSERGLSFLNEFKKNNEILVLDIEDTENFIKNLCLCENIASSSLHGLIFSDSLGIPNTWLRLSNKIHGEHFKFHDYYSSIYNSDISNLNPLEINSYNDLDRIYNSLSLKQIDLDIDKIDNILKSYYDVKN